MRLSLSVLLVTLALCSYGATDIICPSVFTDLAAFLFVPDLPYKAQLQKYNAPDELIEAKLQVKQCTNNITLKNRLIISEILAKLSLKCTRLGLSSLLP
uniref:Secretoglobin family 1A member 1 n=1 Tax=Equus caballus TaxID=9796 RepID=F6SUP2_HORSE|nr:PREDICTED: secretoglobin family 1D member-like [Equus przewalskii]